MTFRLVYVEFFPGNLACRTACVYLCASMCVSPPCFYAHATLATPSAARRSSVRPSKTPHTHTHTHHSPCPACGQTARWHPTKRPTVDTYTLRLTVHYGPLTESPPQSFLVFLFLEVHIMRREGVCLSVLPSVSLYAIWPISLSWTENIGALLHNHRTMCICACVCVSVCFRRQL